MKERPIIFSAPMVRAILEGRKTQTRRAIKPQPTTKAGRYDHQHWSYHHLPSERVSGPSCLVDKGDSHAGLWFYLGRSISGYHHTLSAGVRCPYGRPGDRLWVRESHRQLPDKSGIPEIMYADDEDWDICHHKKGEKLDLGWRGVPSIHMPRWASRITLEVTNIRLEKLCKITQKDAEAEGISTSVVDPSPRGVAPIYPKQYGYPTDVFRDLWESINGAGSWKANPWVWVVEFKVLDAEAIRG